MKYLIGVFLNDRSLLGGALEGFNFLGSKQCEGLALEHSQDRHGGESRLAPSVGGIIITNHPNADQTLGRREELRRAEVLTVDPHGIQDVGTAKLQSEGVGPAGPEFFLALIDQFCRAIRLGTVYVSAIYPELLNTPSITHSG
ncbi:hypothetical protein [Arthrobacter livingstonensis]|uniref:hypothetical protein n=1 Tax=Arthrobacter livingstonensis TaxID=670078 RepID=UPI00147355B5|nr:hypothetical protein [Arthrobacter livingstonensis]